METVYNTWLSDETKKVTYNGLKKIHQEGDYSIYLTNRGSSILTFKNTSILETVKPNKEVLKQILNNIKPIGKYSPEHFIFERALENKEKAIKLFNL